MTPINRRSFLAGSPLMIGLALRGLSKCNSTKWGILPSTSGVGSYSPLTPTKSVNTGETLLALPEGFEYTVLGKAGSKMADGHLTPRAHDGMAAFNINGQLRLIRNHEINAGVGVDGAAFGDQAIAYDGKAGGGTTTLIVDPKTRLLIRDFVSLNGSLQNCAGGPTPWGTWISCEETTLGESVFKDSQGRTRGGFSKTHGYCFEVSAAADAPVKSTPLVAMGRFVHEAIAVDAKTGVVYLTEDRGEAGFYRFIPKHKGKLSEGGVLQMLAVTDKRQFDLRTGQKSGATIPVHWVTIPQPNPTEAEQNPGAVYKQGFDQGAATFARLEGCWYGGNEIFFSATSGGDQRLGQVWQYTPQGKEKGALKLVYESTDQAALDMPDNLCVSPRGGLVICEDGKGGDQFIRGLTRQGRIFDFARNLTPGFEGREFAGATFSPDGATLFVNLQTPGITLAIWGPWEKGGL
jgi:uncharacterized protein